MSSSTFSSLLIFIIGICTLSTVSSDCTSCCLLGTGCSTAYNGESGQCCNQGLGSYCCPTSSVCLSNNECQILYWGMSLGVLIGVIFAVIIGCTLLLVLCSRLLRSRSPPMTHTMMLAPACHNPGVYPMPSHAATSYKY